MTKLISLSLLLVIQSHFAVGQDVKIIKWSALDQKIRQVGDTTLIVNFWATWCKPCVEELPAFEAISRDNKNKKLQVWLVSLDFENTLHTKLRPFLAQNYQNSKIFLLAESDLDQIISQINEKWTGAIPATMFVKAQQRSFLEGPITVSTLLETIK